MPRDRSLLYCGWRYRAVERLMQPRASAVIGPVPSVPFTLHLGPATGELAR